MIPLPQIQIHQQFARIGIESSAGRYEISQVKAELNVETTAPILHIEQPAAIMDIDLDRFWAAFNGGVGVSQALNIYSQMPGIALQNIQQTVEKGNQLADLSNPENPIGSIMNEAAYGEQPRPQYFGPASSDNIDIFITPRQAEIQVELGKVEKQYKPFRTDVEYHRGNVKIYMQQYAAVTITPPALDILV